MDASRAQVPGTGPALSGTQVPLPGFAAVAGREFVFGGADGSYLILSEMSHIPPSAEQGEQERIAEAQTKRMREKIARTPRVVTNEENCAAGKLAQRNLEIAAREPQSAAAQEWIERTLAGIAAQRAELRC